MGEQTVGRDLQQSISSATAYWRLQHPDSFCQTPRTAIPWLLSIISLTVCWSIFLGANDVRRHIRKPFANSLSTLSKSTKWGLRISGSLILQIIFLVATAQLLRKGSTTTNGESTKIASAIGAWAVRPMPGLVVSMTSVMSLSTYHTNAMEIQYVETLLGLVTGYFYINLIPKSQKSISAFGRSPADDFPLAGASATSALSSSTATSTSVSIQATSTQTTSVPAPTALPMSPDGSCGANMGYTCLGSGFGVCCSAFNICGNDADHCDGTGCQPEYGDCSSTAKTVRRRRERGALREKKRIEIRQEATGPDGQCGPGALCWGTKWGNCCSSSSYCGSNDTYCGTGCQPEYGDCWNAETTDLTSTETSSEKELLKNMKSIRGAAILMTAVFVLSFGAFMFLFYTTTRRRMDLAVIACFLVLSLGRFTAAILLWTYALRLGPNGFCLSEKAMTGITVMWAVVPVLDHCWRAVFSN